MSATRAQLIVGVPKIVRSTFVTHCTDDAVISMGEKHSPVMLHGQEIDKRFLEYLPSVKFKPDGRLSTGLVTLLNQWNNSLPGSSGFTASDVPTVVTGSDGAVHTLAATNLIEPWTMDFHPDRNLISDLTLSSVLATGLDLSTSASLYDVTAGGTFADTTFTQAGVIRQQYTGALSGVTGLTTIEGQDGFKVEFQPKFEAVVVNGVTRDFKFAGMGVLVRFIPAGAATTQNILDALQGDSGSTRKPGGSLHAGAAAFTLTGADSIVYLTVPKMNLYTGQFEFSHVKLRTGEIGLYACRDFSSGAQSALYTIANS